MSIIRWLLILPGCVLSWYTVLLVGIVLLSILQVLCPVENFISGHCFADWYSNTETVLIIVFSGISAAVVVLVAWLIAPDKKSLVAIMTYIGGALVATNALIETGAWLEYLSAIVCGLITTVLVVRTDRNRTS